MNGMTKFVAAILAAMMVLSLGCGSDKKAKEQQARVEQQAKAEKAEKAEKAALELMEAVKSNYQNGDFVTANDKFGELKKKYANSKYIAMLNQDYPDLQAKADEQEQLAAAKSKENLNKFNADMSDMFDDIYTGCEVGQGMLVVNVNGMWNLMTRGERTLLVDISATKGKEYELPFSFVVVRKMPAGNVVARWNKNGVSLEDD